MLKDILDYYFLVLLFYHFYVGNQLPSITSKLKNIYYNDSLQIDDVFRMKYSHQILYNNRNASIDAVEKQILVELDNHKFRNNAHWKKWTQNVILRLKTRSVITCPTTTSTTSSINTSSVSTFNHRNKLSPMKHFIKKDSKNNSSHTIRSSILHASNRYINNNDNNFNTNDNAAINDNSSSSQQSHVETVVDSYEPIFLQSYLLLSILVIVFIILIVFGVIVQSSSITTQSQ